MARITVQDCLEKMGNRFDLVLAAAVRARKLATGSAEPCVPWGNDKSPVVALREVAKGYLKEDGSVVEHARTDGVEAVVSVSSTLDDILEGDFSSSEIDGEPKL